MPPDSNSLNWLLCLGHPGLSQQGPDILPVCLKPGHAPPCSLLLSHFRPHQALRAPTPRLTGSTSPVCLGASSVGLQPSGPPLSPNKLLSPGLCAQGLSDLCPPSSLGIGSALLSVNGLNDAPSPNDMFLSPNLI